MTNHGKWSLEGVPHRGWECIGFADLGYPAATCEMCEAQEIRYVHTMSHPDYQEPLDCGCICASNMESDRAAAPERERQARNQQARRQGWLKRQWKISEKGNEYLNVDGCNVVVFPVGDKWRARIAQQLGDHSRLSKRLYPSNAAAKLAAYDALPLLLAYWAKRQ
jgi:hypothetical protein